MKPFFKRTRLFSLALVMTFMLTTVGTITLGSADGQRQRSPFLWVDFSGAFVDFLSGHLSGHLSSHLSAQAQPAPLRRVDPTALSEQVYRQLPDLPRENQYISSETGQIADENTLVSRIIRYHIYNQERPTNFRLDWKLTMADYLGAFERMSPDNYADYGLRENPMASDIAVMESLTPVMRDHLVNALYETFTAEAAATAATEAADE